MVTTRVPSTSLADTAARAHGFVVDEHGACAADRFAAAELGAGEAGSSRRIQSSDRRSSATVRIEHRSGENDTGRM
jgi:hypothetical protein